MLTSISAYPRCILQCLQHTCCLLLIGPRLTFVLATPISAPALINTPQSVPLAMADPTVLVTPTHSAPALRAYSSACSVSAVSPDWLKNTAVSSR